MKFLSSVAVAALCGCALVVGVGSPLANATVVTTGDISVILGNPQPAEPHIFLDSATGTQTATGHVGSQLGDPGTSVINFSNTGVNVDFANGYSTISPSSKDQGAVFNSLTVSVPTGWYFTDLEFGTQKANQVSVTGKFGATTVGTYSNDNIGGGLEAWLVLAINSTAFTSLEITSTDGFDQMKEFAISGLAQLCTENCDPPGEQGVNTPLPAAVWLMGSILGAGAGVGAWRRRKQKAKAV